MLTLYLLLNAAVVGSMLAIVLRFAPQSRSVRRASAKFQAPIEVAARRSSVTAMSVSTRSLSSENNMVEPFFVKVQPKEDSQESPKLQKSLALGRTSATELSQPSVTARCSFSSVQGSGDRASESNILSLAALSSLHDDLAALEVVLQALSSGSAFSDTMERVIARVCHGRIRNQDVRRAVLLQDSVGAEKGSDSDSDNGDDRAQWRKKSVTIDVDPAGEVNDTTVSVPVQHSTFTHNHTQDNASAAAGGVRSDLLGLGGGNVWVTGVGKSGIVAQRFAKTLCSVGLPAHYVHATEWAHGDLGPVDARDTLFAISQSGYTMELVQSATLIKSRGAAVVAIVGTKDSPLAKAANEVVVAPVDKRKELLGNIPTRSIVVQEAVCNAVVSAVATAISLDSETFIKNHPGGSIGGAVGPGISS